MPHLSFDPALMYNKYICVRTCHIEGLSHLCPGLHAAASPRKIAKIARSTTFRVHLRFLAVVSLVNDISRKWVANFAKIAKNCKANYFSRSLAIFRSSVTRNDCPARNRSISRSGFRGLATALRFFTMTPRQKDLVCFWFRLRKYLWAYEFVSFIIP